MDKFRARAGLRKIVLTVFLIAGLAGGLITFAPAPARAACTCPTPTGCAIYDCEAAKLLILGFHEAGELAITKFIQGVFKRYRDWFVDDFFRARVLPDLMYFTQQMSAVGMQQALLIGMFLDAQQQMETQRLLSQLQNEAHRDYQPSDDFCWFGTAVRAMAGTESRSRYHARALNSAQMARHLGNVNQSAAFSQDSDKLARWVDFTRTYCDPQGNDWHAGESGLVLACGTGGGNTERINIDIDYTRLIDRKRSLEINFNPTTDREDVLALGQNLYGHNVLTRDIDSEYLRNEGYQGLYMALRSVAARRNVAQNSYNSIVELKTFGTSDLPNSVTHTREFLASIIGDLGVPLPEIYKYIGARPSYYAQLEILAKKIYQNTDFYTNLYDKPANVARKGVALKAIELMLDRAIYESELRQEIMASVLLSTKLNTEMKDLSERLPSGSAE